MLPLKTNWSLTVDIISLVNTLKFSIKGRKWNIYRKILNLSACHSRKMVGIEANEIKGLEKTS